MQIHAAFTLVGLVVAHNSSSLQPVEHSDVCMIIRNLRALDPRIGDDIVRVGQPSQNRA